MALNPQQEETEVVCLQGLGRLTWLSPYLTALRGLSNPGSGIWLPENSDSQGLGSGGSRTRVTIMYSVNESFFFFFREEKFGVVGGKERVCALGGVGSGTRVFLGFPNYTAVFSLST